VARARRQDKAVLLVKLKEATDASTAVHAVSKGRMQPLLANLGHTSLHYGNMVYLPAQAGAGAAVEQSGRTAPCAA
jgi:hypothetical protein